MKPTTQFDVPKVYEQFRQMGQSDAQKLGWTSEVMQRNIFEILLAMLHEVNIVLPGLTLHDAGCGTGDLLAFLQLVGQEPRRYTGTDFMMAPLEMARLRFPSRDFRRLDMKYTHLVREVKSDVTMVIGAFAFHTPEHVSECLNSLWESTNCALAFNTWWELSSAYYYAEQMEELRAVVEKFLEGKNSHRRLKVPYNTSEACFVVYR